MRLQDAFEDFHECIKLSSLSEERINRAWGRLHPLLTDKFGVADAYVYIQGSYANDTAVKPADEDGEYDLDIVSVHVQAGATAAAAMTELTAVLSEDADLKKRIEPNETGRPCVRLRYADDAEGFKFHIDIVPARGADPKGVIEVPIRGQEEWRQSAPNAYTAWCQAQGEDFLRMVRFLKRWRDEHGDGVRAGEAALIASGRPGIILHPTMIYGAEGEDNVQRLAALLRRLPVAPLPGGGRALVQPIHQSDVTRSLLAALARDWDAPVAVTVAGPRPLPYADFLRAVCRAAGLRAPRVLPVPLAPLLLAAAAARLVPGLPRIRAAELRRLTEDKAFDTGPMRALLGVEPMPLETGLSLTFAGA